MAKFNGRIRHAVLCAFAFSAIDIDNCLGKMTEPSLGTSFVRKQPETVVYFSAPDLSEQDGRKRLYQYWFSFLPLPSLSKSPEAKDIQEFRAVTFSDSAIDGFQIHRIVDICDAKVSELPKTIFPVPSVSQNENEVILPVERKSLFGRVIYNDFLLSATNPSYLSLSRDGHAFLKVGPGKTIDMIDDSLFSHSGTDNFVAMRFFKVDGKSPSEDVCKKIEAIKFAKSDKLMVSPYEVVVVTRRDSLEDAKVLLKEFPTGSDKNEVIRTGRCTFLLTIHCKDPDSFYMMLAMLMTTGYKPPQ